MGSLQQRLERFLYSPGPIGDLLGQLEARTGVQRLYLASGATGTAGSPRFSGSVPFSPVSWGALVAALRGSGLSTGARGGQAGLGVQSGAVLEGTGGTGGDAAVTALPSPSAGTDPEIPKVAGSECQRCQRCQRDPRDPWH